MMLKDDLMEWTNGSHLSSHTCVFIHIRFALGDSSKNRFNRVSNSIMLVTNLRTRRLTQYDG